MSPLSRGLYAASVTVDHGLRTGLASALAAASLVAAPDVVTRRDARRLDWYAEVGREKPITELFPLPGRVRVRTEAGRGPGVPGGRVELLRFDTPYVAVNPDVRTAYSRHSNNAVATAQHWRHDDGGGRPTLVVIHGFGASPAWFNASFFELADVFSEGWDVLLYKLPFHGSRRGRFAPLNGIELVSHGMAHLIEAVLHAVYDLRVFLNHLDAQGSERIGLTGLSLGGYVTALAAAVDERLDFAAPNAAVVDLPRVLKGWFPANLTLETLRVLGRLPFETFAGALALTSPLSYEPMVPKSRRLIVAGLGDRLAPPEQSLLLWEHWGRPRIEWFPGSHVLHFGRGPYRAAMRQLMAAVAPVPV